MTKETDWLASESPASLLYTAEQLKVLNLRKRLLFACGCYRLIWDKFRLPSIREAVETTEKRADRKISQEELSTHREGPRGNPTRGGSEYN